MRFRTLVSAICVIGITASLRGQVDGTAQAKAAFDQGEKALRSDQFDEAIAQLQRATHLDPDFAQAQEEYVSTYIQKPFLELRARTDGRGEGYTREHYCPVKLDV